MNFRGLFETETNHTGISGLFAAYGSFPPVDGRDIENEKIVKTQKGFSAEYDKFLAECEFEELENGVFSRQDFFTAKEDLTLNRYASRFLFEGGEYEVYTQFSTWQHESLGTWQDLSVGVEVSNLGIRTTDGATPMLALRNKGNGKIMVFHLVSNAQWKIKVQKMPFCEKEDAIIVETGINDSGLSFDIKKGERIEMPKIFFFNAERKIDLDAWRLHSVLNRISPRKKLPIIYNSWLYNFDRFTPEGICAQADCASELGIEMFLIDAGWFGTSKAWDDCIGEWVENKEGGFRGKMREVSEYVRSKGIKFGIWLEPERALTKIENVKNHPEYYIICGGNAFLNYADEGAREYIYNVICKLIDNYGVSFMKFDFNAPLAYDESGCGFYRYFAGQKELILKLRKKYPELYITNCASGGTRMDIGQNMLFDSVWISDNQSPVDSVRIIKDTSLRLPPSHMERWDVRRFFDGFPKYGSDEGQAFGLSCNNATWDSIVNVKQSYTYAFMTGGVMGFSTDIAAYPDEEKEALKKLISDYKADRDFYINAVTRILHDSHNITVMQYSDVESKKVAVQAFVNVTYQRKLTIYPVLDRDTVYEYNGEKKLGADIMRDGIAIKPEDYSCHTIVLNS